MQSVCGIDVSKDRLDIMVLPEQQYFSVRNDAAGWAELVERLRGLSISAIGLEASGGYERGAMRALLAAGMPARQVNPFKLRQFARASGVLAKNDPLDTRMIASFVAIMPTLPAQRRAPAIERLTELLAVRRQLNAEKVAAENASRLLEDPMLQRLSRRRIRRLAADIEMLDRHLAEIVGTDAAQAVLGERRVPSRLRPAARVIPMRRSLAFPFASPAKAPKVGACIIGWAGVSDR